MYGSVKFFLCLSLALSALLHGNSFEEQALEAEKLFEAKFYEESIEKYRAIDLNKVPREERSRIKYNIAINTLHLGRWEQARTLFREVIAHNPNDPDLMRRTTFSLALSFLWEGLEKGDRLDEESEEFSDEASRVIGLLQNALKAYQDATEKDQELAVLEGRVLEEQAKDLEELRTASKEALALVIQRQEAYQLQKLPIRQGLRQLADQLEKSVERLELIGRRSKTGKERRRFLTELAIAGKAQAPVWDALAARFEEEEERKKETFAEARNWYLSGLDLMREGELWKSRDAQSAAGLSIALLQLEQEKKDGLAWTLQQRMTLRQKGVQAQEEPEWRGSLTREDAILTDLGRRLAEQLREQVLTASEKNLEEESDPGRARLEMQIQAKMLYLLSQRLKPVEDFSPERFTEAHVDLMFYELVQLQEGDFLLQTYLLAQKLRGKWAGELPETSAQRTEMIERLQVLRTKLTERRRLTTNIPEQNKAQKVNEVLDRAVQFKEGEWEPLVSSLEEALLIWDASKILLAKLAELTDAYYAAYAQNPLQENSLQGLKNGLREMDQTIEMARRYEENLQPLSFLTEDLRDARDLTVTAEQQRAMGNNRTAHAFLNDGRQWIRRGIDRLARPDPVDVQWVLKKGIKEQAYAIELNRATENLEGVEGTGEELLQALMGAQGFVLQSVSDFEESMLREANAAAGGEEITLEAVQRQAPWDEVYPLFEEGLRRAEQGHAHLGVGITELNQALNHQGEALRLWQEALEKLQKNQGEDNGDDDESQEDQPPPSDSPDAPDDQEDEGQQQPQAPEVSPDELFELLQQMDRDDQLPPEKKAPTKKGLRPW